MGEVDLGANSASSLGFSTDNTFWNVYSHFAVWRVRRRDITVMQTRFSQCIEPHLSCFRVPASPTGAQNSVRVSVGLAP